ncbi:c-type cytochrome [Ideonella sp.]|uniref:c-type cytochrome n=1 Tax=Ideonella sp. TaxID=1929293 RepID=UPI002B49007B|nr:c-type cytochrome [Ideonella sp.]HJV71464.1 c-type cytochrome [Ideonella sp.]
MKRHAHNVLAVLGAALFTWLGYGCAPAPVAGEDTAGFDAVKAKSLAAEDRCLRCHGLSKKKEGPSYAEIAAKYRDRPDAESRLYEHLISGEGPIAADGHREPHMIIKAKSPDEIRNVVRWILAQ